MSRLHAFILGISHLRWPPPQAANRRVKGRAILRARPFQRDNECQLVVAHNQCLSWVIFDRAGLD